MVGTHEELNFNTRRKNKDLCKNIWTCVELNHSQVEHNQICSNHDPRTTLPFCCEKYPTQYDAVQSFINGVFLITETSSQSSGPFINHQTFFM